DIGRRTRWTAWANLSGESVGRFLALDGQGYDGADGRRVGDSADGVSDAGGVRIAGEFVALCVEQPEASAGGFELRVEEAIEFGSALGFVSLRGFLRDGESVLLELVEGLDLIATEAEVGDEDGECDDDGLR